MKVNNNNMKLLVTGSNGFVSQNLITFLEKQDNVEEIYAVDSTTTIKSDNEYKSSKITNYCIDISYMPSVVEMFKEFNPDVIIHTAALSSPNIPKNRYTDFSHINICGTHYLAHYAPADCKFIFMSSIVVYGDKYNNKVENPTSLYGASKLSSEKILQVYKTINNLQTLSLRPCAIVGKGLTHGVIKDFIYKINSENPTLEILGNKPGSIKPYIHVDEVIDCIWYYLNNDIKLLKIDLCPSDNISINDIADIVMKKCGKEKAKKWGGQNFVGDNPKILIKKPDWNVKLTSKQAIEKAVDEILCSN